MRFSVVTPCLNAASLIEETIASVSAQSALRDGSAQLQHIVCDGGSTDGTLEILRRLEQPYMRIVSQADRGMYDALARGLRQADGDVVCYLNAGACFRTRALGDGQNVVSAYPQ